MKIFMGANCYVKCMKEKNKPNKTVNIIFCVTHTLYFGHIMFHYAFPSHKFSIIM